MGEPAVLRLPADVQRWLEHEQTLNETLDREPDGRIRILIDHSRLRVAFRPESRGVWPQEVVWLPESQARAYGPVRGEFRAAFGYAGPADTLPLLVHPQPPPAHRRARDRKSVV